MSGPEREAEGVENHDPLPDDAAGQPPPPGWEMGPPPTFPHPPWTVGLVLVLAVVTLVLGLFGHPLWLLAGSPFLLVLGLWLYVQAVLWRRRRAGTAESDDHDEES